MNTGKDKCIVRYQTKPQAVITVIQFEEVYSDNQI